tara:strand:+ start:49 stop:327 length:279 start_codon:yes stop_codon:yes gene_type:complete
MIVYKEDRDNHLRTKSRFYVAGWLDNERCENPQEFPAVCKGTRIADENGTPTLVSKFHKEYMQGYGDSYANGECIMSVFEECNSDGIPYSCY